MLCCLSNSIYVYMELCSNIFSCIYYSGHRAYFADDPRKSHQYTDADPTNCTRVMFYNKVLLGIESIQNTTDSKLVSTPKHFHSVRGTGFQYTEYIIYRYGQALSYFKIIFRI
jgi:hypothetical protein